MSLRSGWRSVVAVGLLAALAAVGLLGRTGRAESDPEPTVVQYPDSNYDPGPGWPAGYTPPAPPTELSKGDHEQWERDRALQDPANRQERLLLRVLIPLQTWTKEYPYVWMSDQITCGKTTYVYYHPIVDDITLRKMHAPTYTATFHGTSGCALAPVTFIRQDRMPTAEEIRQGKLHDKWEIDDRASRGGRIDQGGLPDCNHWVNGTVENMAVCFNGGNASAFFDAPAYLDSDVGRVRVPLRFISERMGAQVTWDGETRSVTISFPAVTRNVVQPVSKQGYQPRDWFPENSYFPTADTYVFEDRGVSMAPHTITVTVSKNVAIVDGKEVPLDAPPVIQPPGRVMVPVRFIAEQMGAKVYWVGQAPIHPKPDGSLTGLYQVHIFTPFYPFYEYPDWFLENRAQKF